MKGLKKIMISILILVVIIQAVQPARNNTNAQSLPTDISKSFSISAEVQASLKKACYDCHSNFTHYPWYSKIQPVGWMLANHIKEGKDELNFNEFGSYPREKQIKKLRSIAKSIRRGDMPMSSYTFIHKEARLTAAEKESIISWAGEAASASHE